MFFDHRSENEAKEEGGYGKSVCIQEVANDAKNQRDVDEKCIVVDAVYPDADKEQNQREQNAVGDRENAHPQAD